MEPKVMLFDEQTSALDPEMIKEVRDTMVGLAEEGMTMICVTREMGFARQVADRVIFMANGAIVKEAPPEAFFRSPRHERTRKFLGEILHKDWRRPDGNADVLRADGATGGSAQIPLCALCGRPHSERNCERPYI